MNMNKFGHGEKTVAAAVLAASVAAGCGASEQSSEARNQDDITISSLREVPPHPNTTETNYTDPAECALVMAQYATKEVLRLVPSGSLETGIYQVEPDNSQSSYVAVEEMSGGTATVKMQVALNRDGQADIAEGEDIAYAVGGELTVMQLSDETWQEALAVARADQTGFPNGGIRVLDLQTGQGGSSNQPDTMCAVVNELQ